MNDQQFRQVLDHFKLSWDGYQKVRKGVKKRIHRHMQELGCRNVEAYLLALDEVQELKEQCERLLTVSISRFFRDRGLWQTLEDHILPWIIDGREEGIKVWIAGCACGEEAYSFTILWDRLKGRFERLPRLEIWGTDMNPLYLYKAQARLFSRTSLKEVPSELRDTYFRQKRRGRQYQILPFMAENITWKVHDLLKDPPPGQGFDLVFLRNNLLTYYTDELKRPAFEKIVGCLSPQGILIIGSHEKLPSESESLIPLTGHSYIFQS
jgi:chemotaxis protein methyltransferase CheR